MERSELVYKTQILNTAFAVIVLARIIAEMGYKLQIPPFFHGISKVVEYLLIIVFIVEIGIRVWDSRDMSSWYVSVWSFPNNNRFDTFILFIMLTGLILASPFFASLCIVVRQLLKAAQFTAKINIFAQLIEQLQSHPARLVLVSFAGIILVGTVLLTFPAATSDGKGADWLTALFTATSATCVTGLIVEDTPIYFSTFGQSVILFLIQVGGLGIMTLSTSLALMFRGRLSVTTRRVMQGLMEETSFSDLVRVILYILKFTLIAELLGVMFLFFKWYGEPLPKIFSEPEILSESANFSTALYYALFHSISAFCNAGFALFVYSFEGYTGNWTVNLVITSLIIFGGIGFSVVSETISYERIKEKFRGRAKVSLHTRLVLLTTGILLIAGLITVLFFESGFSLAGMPLKDKILASWFQSVTPRTAGFNTIRITELRPVTIFTLMLLMFIGASPGSTGGGIKTSTTAVMALSIKSMLFGREEIEAYKRTISRQIFNEAVSITTLSVTAVVIAFLGLLAVEPHPFSALLFEAISAFGTVGLSTGVTSKLSSAGRLIIIGLMFTGRTGPLTLALALGQREEKANIKYPEGKVMVG